LVIDEDIIKEYTHALRSEIQARSAKNKFPDLSDNILFHNTYIISAATHHGIESWLEKLARSLTLLPAEADYLPTNEDIDIYHEQEEFVTDITEQEKPILIEKEYIDPVLAKYSKVRYVSDLFVSKLVYQMPWSNDEAEMRFWKTLEQRGIINQLEEAGVQKNDILKIKSYYNGAEDKHILY
jgi:Obg family GTPase CgtA-like protein